MIDTVALRLAAAELVVLRAKIDALRDEPPEPADEDVDDLVTELRDRAAGYDDDETDET